MNNIQYSDWLLQIIKSAGRRDKEDVTYRLRDYCFLGLSRYSFWSRRREWALCSHVQVRSHKVTQFAKSNFKQFIWTLKVQKAHEVFNAIMKWSSSQPKLRPSETETSVRLRHFVYAPNSVKVSIWCWYSDEFPLCWLNIESEPWYWGQLWDVLANQKPVTSTNQRPVFPQSGKTCSQGRQREEDVATQSVLCFVASDRDLNFDWRQDFIRWESSTFKTMKLNSKPITCSAKIWKQALLRFLRAGKDRGSQN